MVGRGGPAGANASSVRLRRTAPSLSRTQNLPRMGTSAPAPSWLRVGRPTSRNAISTVSCPPTLARPLRSNRNASRLSGCRQARAMVGTLSVRFVGPRIRRSLSLVMAFASRRPADGEARKSGSSRPVSRCTWPSTSSTSRRRFQGTAPGSMLKTTSDRIRSPGRSPSTGSAHLGIAGGERGRLLVALFGHDVPEGLLVPHDVLAGLLQETPHRTWRLRCVHHHELRRSWPGHARCRCCLEPGLRRRRGLRGGRLRPARVDRIGAEAHRQHRGRGDRDLEPPVARVPGHGVDPPQAPEDVELRHRVGHEAAERRLAAVLGRHEAPLPGVRRVLALLRLEVVVDLGAQDGPPGLVDPEAPARRHVVHPPVVDEGGARLLLERDLRRPEAGDRPRALPLEGEPLLVLRPQEEEPQGRDVDVAVGPAEVVAASSRSGSLPPARRPRPSGRRTASRAAARGRGPSARPPRTRPGTCPRAAAPAAGRRPAPSGGCGPPGPLPRSGWAPTAGRSPRPPGCGTSPRTPSRSARPARGSSRGAS